MLLIYTIGVGALAADQEPQPHSSQRHICVMSISNLYLLGFWAVEGYCALLHPAAFQEQLPFLPLMLRSVYSAIGVSAVWLQWTRAGLVDWSDKAKSV